MMTQHIVRKALCCTGYTAYATCAYRSALSRGIKALVRYVYTDSCCVFSASIPVAAAALQQGRLVAFPTETVYGLGARGLDEASVLKIFAAKGRPLSSPLILHVASANAALPLFDFTTLRALKVFLALTEAFWPGPLTIVHRADASVPTSVTAGTGRVGVRVPGHPVALKLLETCGFPLAAPSANRFGHVSPTTSRHVFDDLHDKDVLILTEEAIVSTDQTHHSDFYGINPNLHKNQFNFERIGIESTVCAIEDNGDQNDVVLKVLRCGYVTTADIKRQLSSVPGFKGVIVEVINGGNTIANSSGKSRCNISDSDLLNASPGQVLKHYAPDKRCYIVKEADGSADGSAAAVMSKDELKRTFVLDVGGRLARFKDVCAVYDDLSEGGDVALAYQRLYSTLRRSEKVGIDLDGRFSATSSVIVDAVLLPDLSCESLKDEQVRALWDRLSRAASGNFVRIL